MALILSVEEIVSRARADLRIGAPVALVSASGGAVVVAAETLSEPRLSDLRGLGAEALDLAITARRAETLRARCYDDGLARVILDDLHDARFVQATADPSVDLATPMKGPYATRREGPSDLHALALILCKQARLLPAALVAVWPEAGPVEAIAEAAGLTRLDEGTVQRASEAAIRMHQVSGARVPTRFAKAGRCLVFRPEDGGEEHYAVEVGRPSRQ
ncbi:MAG: GTP cyclohydrolase II, partial [Pseudomonadota bacterium]